MTVASRFIYAAENQNRLFQFCKIAYWSQEQISVLDAKLRSAAATIHGNLQDLYTTKTHADTIHREFMEGYIGGVQTGYDQEIQLDPLKTKKELISFKKLKFKCKQCAQKILEEIAQHYGVEIMTHKFQLNEEDLATENLNVKEQAYKDIISSFNGIRYALYQANEPEAKEWIFGKLSLPPFASGGIMETMTQKWGYSIVKTPRKGDIILYLDELRKPLQLGVFEDSENVTSKWGKLPQIFLHPKEQAPYPFKFFLILRRELQNPIRA